MINRQCDHEIHDHIEGSVLSKGIKTIFKISNIRFLVTQLRVRIGIINTYSCKTHTSLDTMMSVTLMSKVMMSATSSVTNILNGNLEQ